MKLELAKNLRLPKKDLSVIYASIAQTYQDLDKYLDALEYYNHELECLYSIDDSESVSFSWLDRVLELQASNLTICIRKACKSLLNVAIIKEKLNASFEDLQATYSKAYEKAKLTGNSSLQFKCIKLLKQTEDMFKVECEETQRIFSSLSQNEKTSDDDEMESDENSNEDGSEVDDDDRSLSFSSESKLFFHQNFISTLY